MFCHQYFISHIACDFAQLNPQLDILSFWALSSSEKDGRKSAENRSADLVSRW